MEKVIPYDLENQPTKRPKLSLLERQWAVRLALEGADVLVARTVKGTRWLYCRKRILGAGRPTLDGSDVSTYERTLHKKTWSMEDFYLIANIRKFKVDSCVCSAYLQYVNCYHCRAARIKYGFVVPATNEQPSGDPTSEEVLRADRAVNQKVASTYCYICQRECRNAPNRDAHSNGQTHLKQMSKFHSKISTGSVTTWGSHRIEKVKAHELKRGDVVFVSSSVSVLLQGVVSGVLESRRKAAVHVAISQHKEVVLSRGQNGSEGHNTTGD